MNKSDFRAAFQEHKDTVYRFVWRMMNSPDAAEDITQDVFLALLRRPDSFDAARGELRPFLLGIAHKLVLKAFRRDASRWVEFDEEQFVGNPLDVAGREIAGIVGAAVRSLPPLQREVLVLAQYEGFSLEEIARSVGAEVGTVKSRLHRARENLKRKLAPLRGDTMGRSKGHGTTKRL